jgi:hypothetical protein
VNFVDKTLVALADPASRPATFDQKALEQIVSAGYDATAMAAQGPFSAVFDEFRLGISTEPEGVVDGTLQPVGGSEQTTARFRLTGLLESTALRVDALWRGSVVARFARGGEPITKVVTNWPTLGTIDAEIAQANGGVLPSNPSALETQRRTQFVAHMRTALDQPNLFDDPALDKWLEAVGAESVGDLLEHFVGSVDPGTLTVTFASPAAAPATPQPLPIAAAILVRDAPLSLAELLMESALVRERLRALGAERPAEAGLRRLQPVLVIWVIPDSVFNDTDWPGANPAARRANAGAWLAREGIGLAATP